RLFYRRLAGSVSPGVRKSPIVNDSHPSPTHPDNPLWLSGRPTGNSCGYHGDDG
ncbi:hypothetical protein HN51_028118, partial [Arachis hypogaea]